MSYWIAARELSITWSEDPQYWTWVLDTCSSEVAELVRSCWIEIIGKIDMRSMRVKTSYSAFLVFKLLESSSELHKATASVRFVKEITEGSADEGYGVFIDPKACADLKRGRFPHCRSDGWMEIKLGEFFNNLGDDGEVELRLIEKNNPKWKTGLVVRGIDIRPN